MQKTHKVLVCIVAALAAICSSYFQLDYRNIASEGMTLSSIALAVYIAAMMGLGGSNLGKKLAMIPSENPEYTQLWVLRRYFRNAVIFAVLTIVTSSFILLLPQRLPEETVTCSYQILSTMSLAIYAVNLVFMGLVMKFILNRQIWDT